MSRRSWLGPQSLNGLAVMLGLLAGLAAVIGVLFVSSSSPEDGLRDIGRWCLQLALVFAGTGVVSVVVRQYELARTRRDAWTERLHELVGAHDDVQLAARLLSAHMTAKTYSEQVMVLTSARATLRRLASVPDVQADTQLHGDLVAMRRYLKYLVKEYQQHYLPVARQQRLDEAVLTFKLRAIAEVPGSKFPELPPELGLPLPAGLALQDPERFPCLNDLTTRFNESSFREAYTRSKPNMQLKAGIPPDKDLVQLSRAAHPAAAPLARAAGPSTASTTEPEVGVEDGGR
jgi:hypothetical protein